jgi:hypothetical protein
LIWLFVFVLLIILVFIILLFLVFFLFGSHDLHGFADTARSAWPGVLLWSYHIAHAPFALLSLGHFHRV